MAPQTSTLFGEKVQPCVLPHHLFIMAAASVSKENDLFPLNKINNTGDQNMEKQQEMISTIDEKSQGLVDSVITQVIEEEEDEDWKEERLIIDIVCTVNQLEDSKGGLSLKLLLRLEDEMNRQLCRKITDQQRGIDLATELVDYGLISELDRDKVATVIDDNINTSKTPA